MKSLDQQAADEFENEVRRIARHLWPSAQYGGAAVIENRQRDGVFETEECIHLVEATTSRQKDKAKADIGKLVSLAGSFRRRSVAKPLQCWFITRSEPTADQPGVASKHKGLVNVLSFSQFQSRLIDAPSYLQTREAYPFGSVRDPATGRGAPSVDYVSLDLVETGTGALWEVDRMLTHVEAGGGVILLGDFGAGKSMTLREIYRELKKKYLRDRSVRFPVYVNMRDHHGQTSPAEILERHARNTGFGSPSHLVRAWLAGYAILLLDGFDEVGTLGIQGAWKKLRDTRYRATQALRGFVRQMPKGVGFVLAGRAHFFDGDKERRSALALESDPSFVELSLNEFTDDQMRRYLEKSGYRGRVPGWIPSRPLLLGYLAARGLMEAALKSVEPGPVIADPARGWDDLIDRVTAREAEIEAGIDGVTLRRILERIATKARSSPGGLGPIPVDDIVAAFKEICGYPPDEQAMVLLQRLPGLGIDPAGDQSRSFIDESLADALRAGDVAAFADTPFNIDATILREAEGSLGSLGVGVAVQRLERSKCPPGKLLTAIRRAAQVTDGGVLTADLVHAAISRADAINEAVYVKRVFLQEFELTADIGDVSHLEFQDCYFARIGLDVDLPVERLPGFRRCFFSEVEGRVSERDLPRGVFDADCIFDSFTEAAETTDAILNLDLALGVKVLLTVLKKLYLQRGSGRRESALYRGLDHKSRRLVPDVIRLLQTEGVVTGYSRKGAAIWLPDRTQMVRIGRIIASPNVSEDALLRKATELQ